jgi:hypothetical protein
MEEYLPRSKKNGLESLRPFAERAFGRIQDSISKIPPAPVTPAVAAAREVMRNARSLCSVRNESDHLVVECRSLGSVNPLGFARSLSDADAVLTGQARNIYFYEGAEQFAQADRLRGVRLTK